MSKNYLQGSWHLFERRMTIYSHTLDVWPWAYNTQPFKNVSEDVPQSREEKRFWNGRSWFWLPHKPAGWSSVRKQATVESSNWFLSVVINYYELNETFTYCFFFPSVLKGRIVICAFESLFFFFYLEIFYGCHTFT